MPHLPVPCTAVPEAAAFNTSSEGGEARTPYQLARRRLFECTSSSWGVCTSGQFTQTARYDIVNWNFDAARCAGRDINKVNCAVQRTIPIVPNVVSLNSSFAYLGANLRFFMKIGFFLPTLQEFELSASATAAASLDVQVAAPVGGYSGTSTTTLVPRCVLGLTCGLLR